MIVFLTVLFLALLVFWGWFSSGLVMKINRLPISVLPGAYGLPFEKVSFSSSDGIPLKGWFIPGGSSTDQTIVLCHGWGANRSDILPMTCFLQEKGGYNLFYFDFRNHGESGGKTSSLTTLEARDLEAAVNFLKESKPEQAKKIAFYGLSMGGAVSLSVASQRQDIMGVIAESPFSSYNESVIHFAKLFYGIPRFPLVDFTLWVIRRRLGVDPEIMSPINHIQKISPRPVFLIQGDSDLRMPIREGQVLYEKAQEPKTLWTVPGADHGQVSEAAGLEYEKRILEFYKMVFQ